MKFKKADFRYTKRSDWTHSCNAKDRKTQDISWAAAGRSADTPDSSTQPSWASENSPKMCLGLDLFDTRATGERAISAWTRDFGKLLGVNR